MTAAGPRVLQVLGPSTGGIRRHVGYLTDRLRASGWVVDVAGPPGVLDDLRHEVEVPGGTRLLDGSAGLARARRKLRSVVGDYDLVHAHGLKVGWLLASLRARPPVVLSVHNLVLDEVAGRAAVPMRWLEGHLPGRVAATIAISGQVAERFDGRRGSDRIRVVPPAGPPPRPDRSPVQVRAELGVGAGEDLVVTAARLHPQKGLDLLLEAASRVRELRPGLRWFVFGEGPDRDALHRDIARRGLEGTVVLAGGRPNVDAELAAADAVAVTSRWESGPLVVLEALALARPVVSTRVGLAPDVLDADPRSRTVAVGDAEGFAAALAEVLADPSPRAPRMPGSGPQFEPSALAARVEDVYRELLSPA